MCVAVEREEMMDHGPRLEANESVEWMPWPGGIMWCGGCTIMMWSED